MKVLKFGGTSVGSVESIQRVKKIVDAMADPAIVVVSAVGGITDKLIATTTKAVAADTTYTTDFENICNIHNTIIDGVVPADKLTSVKEQVNVLLEEVGTILKGIEGIETISSKDMDLVVSYGERISSIIVASVLDAKHWNSLELVKTDKGIKKNVLNSELTYSNIDRAYNGENRVVMGGFISTDAESGEITNLGRGGSDYTAAIVASALNAEALEIWTDVDGFLTADPRLVRNAYTIENMSYIEAVELSNFGAKVIYPPTIYPVYEKNIPLYIRNSYNPDFKGTKISGQKSTEGKAIKGISSINDTCLITLQGMGMVGVSGISSRTFQALANQGISVFLISQASSENSTTFAIKNEEAEVAVQALKEETKLPIELHAHYTSGVASMTYMKAVEAGVDIIDTAMSPFALGTSQPATEVMVETFKGTEFDTGLDQQKLAKIADYFRPLREEALKSGLMNTKVLGVNIKTLLYQVPGGMLSNLVSQLKEANAEDKYQEVLEEIPRVRKDFGEPPLVTPSSQIVGTQAVLNVLQGERYKILTKESKKVLSGEFGMTVKPFNEEVQKKAIDDKEPIICRPADLIEPQLEQFEKECAEWKKQDEDVLTYALFPKVATDYFKYRKAQEDKVDLSVADTASGSYPI